MTRNTRTDVPRQPQDEGKLPQLPRRNRIGSALASSLITAVLFGSVVIGMTSMADDGQTMAGAAAATRQA